MNIELSKAEIDSILKDKSNPLYRRIQDLFPVEILPTIESLYVEGKIEGYYLTPSGIINFVELSGRCDDNIWAVNGIAPSKSAVERTVLEYKIQHLIIANGLKGTNYSILYDNSLDTIVCMGNANRMFASPIRLGGSLLEAKKFAKDYETELRTYFELFKK